jgi:hypothetical protein
MFSCRWPQLAKQHRVEVHGISQQLPTFIMFRGGKELGRIPRLLEGGWTVVVLQMLVLWRWPAGWPAWLPAELVQLSCATPQQPQLADAACCCH